MMPESTRERVISSCETIVERYTILALWRIADAIEDIAEYLQEKKP
jgi:hypothetical protein